EDLLKTSAANREAVTKLVRFELDRALGAVGLATADEVATLNARVRELEAQLRVAKAPAAVEARSAAAPVGAEAAKATAKKAPAKRAVKKAVSAPVAPGWVEAAPAAAEPAAPPVAKAPAKTAAKAPAKSASAVKKTAVV